MAPQNGSTNAFTSSRSPATAAVDNVLRRALKISDPNNADEVAKGLLARYPDDAARIRREQMGLPFSVFRAQLPAAPQPYQGRPETTAASNALDIALTDLTTNPKLADIRPELRGWDTTIRRAAADGLAAAGFAIDPSKRDEAFGARRVLGDFARLARYTGALTSCAPDIYCRVAEACDDIANIILVLIGDAFGDAGVARSGAVLRVPGTTLQTRFDAVLIALRNLTRPASGDDEESWPRGTYALSQLYDGLDDAGSPDLRALLEESYLSRQLGILVDMANGSSADSIRTLSSAAATTLQSLQRFLIIANDLISPPSPPASMFFAELRMFIQGFASSNVGYRLPYLSRSPLLVSAFAASAGIDAPTQTLLSIALSRTAFADAVDCLCCLCGDNDAKDMILAGKVLFDIDRAIDLYALGSDTAGNGGAEWRAAVYGVTITNSISRFQNPILKKPGSGEVPGQGAIALQSIAAKLPWPPAIANPNVSPLTANQLVDAIDTQFDDEVRWSELVSTVAPMCRQDLLFRISAGSMDPIAQLLKAATESIKVSVSNSSFTFTGPAPTSTLTFGDKTPTVDIPPPIATSFSQLVNDEETSPKK
jgi:hypothetical protein